MEKSVDTDFSKNSRRQTMKIFAHRGFSGEYPENTMLAFKEAEKTGCDGIELDVQLTKDLVPVIIHDEKIDRTSSGKGRVCDYTFDELRSFSFGYSDKFGGQFFEAEIPCLEEYLKWMAEEACQIITNIELKNSVYYYGGMERMVVEMVRKYGLLDRVILSSFNNASVLKCKEIEPSVKTGFLTEAPIGNPGVYTKEFGVDYYHPDLSTLTEEHVKNCSENGIGVNVWTVNEREDFLKMKKWGISRVFTNYPDRGREIISEMR